MISVEELREERGNECENGCGRQGTQRHHVFFGKQKGHPEYDHEYNLCLVCSVCHIDRPVVNGRKFREWFWKVQVERYGQDFIDWYESVPTKTRKEHYEN